MKKTLFFAAAAATMMLGACSNDEEVAPVAKSAITASIEEGTRTAINGLHVTWSAGDQIAAYNYSANDSKSTYTLDKGAGTGQGTFKLASGTEVNDVNFRGFYPTTSEFYTTTIRHQISLIQNGVLEDGEIPMYGDFEDKGDGNYHIQFHHTCGIIRFVFSGNEAMLNELSKIRLKFTANIKDAVRVNNGSPVLTYENRAGKADLDVNISGLVIPVKDGKRTVDVLCTPSNAGNTINAVWLGSSNTTDLYLNDYIRAKGNIPVEAGKVTTINVKLSSDKPFKKI